MSGQVKFKVVGDDLRKLAASPTKWNDVIQQVRIGRTVAIEPAEARAAANALTPVMRQHGLVLHRKTMQVEGSKMTILWADKPLGN